MFTGNTEKKMKTGVQKKGEYNTPSQEEKRKKD